MRDYFFLLVNAASDVLKYNRFGSGLAVVFHLFNVKLREKHWARRGEYRVFGRTFCFDHVQSLIHLLLEHFVHNVYYFRSEKEDPVIFDVGANIGDSVFYFKHLFPRSRIFAFEPAGRPFALLRKNVEANDLGGVHLYNEALLDRDGALDLYLDEGTYLNTTSKRELIEAGSRRAAPAGEPRRIGAAASADKPLAAERVAVRKFSARVAALGIEHIDLLKIDIEGDEAALMRDVRQVIGLIDNIALEYHVLDDVRGNSLDSIFDVLRQGGFEFCVFNKYRTVANWTESNCFMVFARRKR